MNFKVGDKFLVTANSEELAKHYLHMRLTGNIYEVCGVDKEGYVKFTIEEEDHAYKWNLPFSYIVHEDLYNSPLWQALK